MSEFPSLGSLALHLAGRTVAMAEELEHGLERALKLIERTALDEIGVYQASAGPFPAWPQLAEATEERKAAMGYPADAPLLASGDMRDSLSHEVHGLEGGVGFSDPVAVYQEFGTSKVPARPVLGPAAFRNRELIEKLIGAAVVAGLVGDHQVHTALGYDMEVGSEAET